MKKSAYIITKPLQYINATNIDDENLKDCYLEDNFSSFNLFVNSVKSKSNHWDKIYTCKTKQFGLFKIILNRRKYSKIYIDSDLGILVRLSLFLLYPLEVYVYEEGFASYTASYRVNNTYKDVFLSIIDKIICGENWSGGSARTYGIFLYHKKAFINIVCKDTSKQLLDFKSKFSEHIISIPEIDFLFDGVDFELFRGKKVLVYLSSWEINTELNSFLIRYPNHIKIIKPHPHIKKLILLNDSFDHIIENMLPAEILISKIIKISKEIVVIHEGSAAMLSFNESDKFKEYNINKDDLKQQDYNELKKYFV